MTFSLVGTDSPFSPGDAIGNFSVDPSAPDSRVVDISVATFQESTVWPAGYSSIFGNVFDYAANGDVTLKSTGGGGGSARPASGLMYPRLVG